MLGFARFRKPTKEGDVETPRTLSDAARCRRRCSFLQRSPHPRLDGGSVGPRGRADCRRRHIGGIVPPLSLAGKSVCNPCGSGKLINHGGPTMTTNKTYMRLLGAVRPVRCDSGYVSTINQFFQDVAHDSGMPTNVYAATRSTRASSTRRRSAATYTDTRPRSRPTAARRTAAARVCLSDAQLQTEINNVIASQGWTKNSTNMFFMFTPKNVESCDSRAAAPSRPTAPTTAPAAAG